MSLNLKHLALSVCISAIIGCKNSAPRPEIINSGPLTTIWSRFGPSHPDWQRVVSVGFTNSDQTILRLESKGEIWTAEGLEFSFKVSGLNQNSPVPVEVYVSSDPSERGTLIPTRISHQQNVDTFWSTIVITSKKDLIREVGFKYVRVNYVDDDIDLKVIPLDFRLISARLVSDFGGDIVGGYLVKVVEIDCTVYARPISPLIYGISFNGRRSHVDDWVWEMGVTARRWGGNPTSRYNWSIGNAWNSGADWYFKNSDPSESNVGNLWRAYISDNLSNGAVSAITLPIIGWVAKDTESYSFPVSRYGKQRSNEPLNNDVGDGVGFLGDIISGDPRLTSVKVDENFVGDWVREMSEVKNFRDVIYFMDNEPMLWHDTHRDIHPNPVSYEEIMEKTVRHAFAVRKYSKDASIAGPSLWGWTAYFYTAEELFKPGVSDFDDDKSFISRYLKGARKAEHLSGIKIIDFLDVHYYPQFKGVHSDENNQDIRRKRIESTRSLWDFNYVDGSWVEQPVYLVPRLKKIIEDHYPGLGLIIGEYSFGGENDVSGAVAQAEALGRFAEGGVEAAFYWVYPPRYSPVYWSFRAFRNFDGNGSSFESNILNTFSDGMLSAFSSISDDRKRIVVIVTYKGDQAVLRVNFRFHDGCDYSLDSMYDLSPSGLVGVDYSRDVGGVVFESDGYGVSVFDFSLAD